MMNGESLHWRPITTAPRDKTILVYSLRWGTVVALYNSKAGAWTGRMQGPGDLNGADQALITHWMPMPGVPGELTGSRQPWHSLAA